MKCGKCRSTVPSKYREVVVRREVERCGSHLTRHPVIGAVVSNLQQQVSWVTRSKLAIAGEKMLVDQILNCVGFVFESHRRRESLKDFLELFFRRIRNLDLVRDPSKKGSVDKVFRFKVCRENDELVERNLNFLAAGQIDRDQPFVFINLRRVGLPGPRQRLRSSSTGIRCRPKSSMTSVPQLLFS